MLERKIISTDDGSSTLYIPEWNESYHSRHGAIEEAFHVFIRNGLDLFSHRISILEIGFGTGLNALISLTESANRALHVNYTALEKYPLSEAEYSMLNYPEILAAYLSNSVFSETSLKEIYLSLMQSKWELETEIRTDFYLRKICTDFLQYDFEPNSYNLIYFDAFGARVQPELWTIELFEKLFTTLMPDGLLTTYSAKGSVRRAMQEVGFKVEKRPGPPGKREMLIARK